MSTKTNIAFKKGSHEAFALAVKENKIQTGALYLTENEGCLYLGTGTNTVKRIQGSVVFYDEIDTFTQLVQPPYSEDVIYYIVKSNALIHWNLNKIDNGDGTFTAGWDQLNISETQLDEFEQSVNEAIKAIESEVGTINTSIGNFITLNDVIALGYATTSYVDGIKDDIVGTDSDLATALTLKGLSKNIEAVTGIANQAKNAAATAETLAGQKLDIAGGTLTGDLNMSGKNIKSLANPASPTDAANKSYVDAEIAKVVAKSDALVFRGVLTSSNSLPASANIGDTYKVGENGTYFGSMSAKIGDLIICVDLDSENNNAPIWDIVPSGDELSYIQDIIASPTDNTFYITNGVDETVTNALTGVKIESDNNNIVFTTSNRAGKLYTVTASLVWDSF